MFYVMRFSVFQLVSTSFLGVLLDSSSRSYTFSLPTVAGLLHCTGLLCLPSQHKSFSYSNSLTSEHTVQQLHSFIYKALPYDTYNTLCTQNNDTAQTNQQKTLMTEKFLHSHIAMCARHQEGEERVATDFIFLFCKQNKVKNNKGYCKLCVPFNSFKLQIFPPG